MLPTIVFFFALLFSSAYIQSFIVNAKKAATIWDTVYELGTILLWSWLFYLLH